MSAILGVFGNGRPIELATLRDMAAHQASRGASTLDCVDLEGASLAVGRYDWELSAGHSGDVTIVEDDDLVIAADACLFYRRDLEDRLEARGVEACGESPSHTILAAYRAWGDRCAERLEGSFAFVVYDKRRREVFCARDFAGGRPLFYAELGDDLLVVASTVAAILAHPVCPGDLNLPSLGAAAAGWLWSYGADTCYSAIQVLPMAGSLKWTPGRMRIWRHWQPPSLVSHSSTGFADAADELRELLAQAVSERLAPAGPTTVSMSGGRDSTAVFAAGQYALADSSGSQQLRPVSIRYPEGDLGREDDFIEAVAERWKSEIHWLEIEDIPMFHRDAERAATRDQPVTTPYENWNVALARGARACGAHIQLDGNGGDQLFQVSDIYLSDLLRSGQFLELARELRRKRSTGRRHLFDMTVQPLLPNALLALLDRLGLVPRSPHYISVPLPAWLRPDFVRRSDLWARQLAMLPAGRGPNREEAELRWLVTSPLPGYLSGLIRQRSLEVGVDIRAPLMDRRIVEFAFGRPREDRVLGLDTKRLLRESMRGLIPEAVLAPRRFRTGLTVSYSRRSMQRHFPSLFADLFRAPLRLAELGILDPGGLRHAVSAYESGRSAEFERLALFHTLQAELWLRGQAGQTPRDFPPRGNALNGSFGP